MRETLERKLLVMVEKVVRPDVNRNKDGRAQGFCPLIIHQPKRPTKNASK